MLKESNIQILFRAGLILWLIAVGYASLAPLRTMPESNWLHFPHADKVVHFCMYLGVCFFIFYNQQLSTDRKRLLIAIGFAVAYGSLMELMQHIFTDTRQADVLDFLANSAGATSFVFFRKTSDKVVNCMTKA